MSFIHEHSRSDRDEYVTINTNCISSSQVAAINFQKDENSWLATEYDYHSVRSIHLFRLVGIKSRSIADVMHVHKTPESRLCTTRRGHLPSLAAGIQLMQRTLRKRKSLASVIQ